LLLAELGQRAVLISKIIFFTDIYDYKPKECNKLRT